MSKVTLENVLALNQELAALAEVGIPTNLAPGASQHEVAGLLEQISSSLALRLKLGQTLTSATSDNQDIPPVYRSALKAGLRSNRLSATLDGISRQAASENELRSTLGRSLVSPLIVLALGYLGFIFLCLYFSPTFEGMYEQVGQPPSRSVGFLVTMREWLPYWATILPLLVLGVVIFGLRGQGRWQRLVPGARRYAETVRNASFAHQMTLLLENNVPLEESLPVAAAVTADERLIAAAGALSEARVQNDPLAADAEVLRTLPPLLRWALTGDLGDQSLPEILRFAEKTYRHTAERRAALWRFVLPTMIGALMGGSIVLAYGLSVFVPFVRLLEDLAY